MEATHAEGAVRVGIVSDYDADGAWMSERLSAAMGRPMRVVVHLYRDRMYDEDGNPLDEMYEEVVALARWDEKYMRVAGEVEQYDRGLMYQALEQGVRSTGAEPEPEIVGYTSCPACNGTGCDRCMPQTSEDE